MKWLAALAIVLGSFFGTLWLLEVFYPNCPRGETLLLHGPFTRFSKGFAYMAAAPSLKALADDPSASTRSAVALCENASRLGPAHTLHAEIDAKGNGRFSHWDELFVFSASDNSDPNSNGRQYSAVLQR
jgi:hypothetical protein